MPLTPQELLAKVAKAKEKAAQSENNRGGNFPSTSFLPDGEHVIRFLNDPSNEIYREFHAYGAGRKALIDPSYLDKSLLPEGFKDRLKEIAEETGRWKLKSRYCFLIYGYLVATSNPGEYWKPNQLYLIIGDGKLRTAFLKAMETYADDIPEQFILSLDPKSSGNPFQCSVVKGQGGSINLMFKIGNKSVVPPIDVTKGYIPLEDAYVTTKSFNKEKWDERVQEYEVEYADYLEKVAAGLEGPGADDQAANAAASEASANASSSAGQETKTETNTTENAAQNTAAAASTEQATTTQAEQAAPGANKVTDENDPWANFNS